MEIIEVTGTELYSHDRYNDRARKVYLSLDCENETLRFVVDHEPGSTPFSVYHGRTLYWSVPAGLTSSAANELLETVQGDAEDLLTEYSSSHDRHGNLIGSLTERGEELRAAIGQQCDRLDASDALKVWDAADWYAPVRRTIAATLGITAETTDAEIATIAEAEENSAAASGEADMLEGAERYLRGVRDDLREAE